MLLLQGVGVAGCGWRPQIDGLKDAFETVWVDNRGVGGSPGPVGSVASMADDALGVMDALGWPVAHVVGHSLGGVIAQDMAVRAPERVASLALLCTFARGRAALSFRPADLWLNLRTTVGTAEMRRRAFYELVADPALPADEGRIAALEEAFGRPLHALPPAATAQLMALTRADLREGLAGVRVPALVMSATHDRLAPPAQGRELAGILGVPFVEVPGGHAVPVQDASRVNGLLREHLERAS